MASHKIAMITQEAPAGELPDWQRQQADAITCARDLLTYVNVAPSAMPVSATAAAQFPVRVPRVYADLMEKGNPHDPLLRQVLAVPAEDMLVPEYSHDPLEESAHTPVPGVLHKYHGRALLVTTGACAVHCRYCFRRHFPYGEHQASQWQAALDWLAEHDDIQEVILSGGDPLTLSPRRIAALLSALAAIPHLRYLRIHSRTPVVMPARLDEALLAQLASPRWRTTLVLHANHPAEISSELKARCLAWQRAGVTLLNQSVLLAGVNDESDTLAALSFRLHDAGILPYYLHQLDTVQGAAHFAVPDAQARQLHADVRARLPGYLVPRLSREEPGENAKTVLQG